MEGIVWESVWVAVGFVAFAALVWKRLSGVINTMLDDRSSKIKAAETAMINELREKAASLAVASAAQIITSKLDDKAGLALVDDAAGEIEKLN